MSDQLPVSQFLRRRPVYDRYLRRKHHMRLDSPTEAEIEDARRLLADGWDDELIEEARRVLEESE